MEEMIKFNIPTAGDVLERPKKKSFMPIVAFFGLCLGMYGTVKGYNSETEKQQIEYNYQQLQRGYTQLESFVSQLGMDRGACLLQVGEYQGKIKSLEQSLGQYTQCPLIKKALREKSTEKLKTQINAYLKRIGGELLIDVLPGKDGKDYISRRFLSFLCPVEMGETEVQTFREMLTRQELYGPEIYKLPSVSPGTRPAKVFGRIR